MNIAVLASHLPSPNRAKNGGVTYVAHRLANAFCRRGHSVTIFSSDEKPPDALYDVRTVLPPTPDSPLRAWLWNWRLVRQYASQDFGSFDIIHAHGNNAFIWRPGLPLVRTFHGSTMAEAIKALTWKKRLWYLTLAPREAWEAVVADVVVSVSAHERRFVPGIDIVLPNFVDRSVFYANGDPAPNPVVLFVGTLVGRKRGQLLLEIFHSQIRPALPNAELWLVAEKTVDLPGVVCFEQPHENELADLYRRAWIFCLPSTYEGFGVPYIEALACGTPVVATPNAGAREVLEKGKWGILASPSELGDVLLSVLEDEPRRQRLGKEGLKRAAAFELGRVVDAYESLFEDTIRRASG